MKTALYRRNGPADAVLELVTTPDPQPGYGEILVKLKTSGVNPSDVKSRAGREPAFDFIVPHSDGAGIIQAVGEGVDQARIGERVWVWNGQWQRQFGTAAEFICLPEKQVVALDDDVDFETAACFGIPGLTAAYAVDLLNADTSQTILVTGGGSSVGHYITQMAALSGRKVIATASNNRKQSAYSAGASAVIDYQNEDIEERILELTNGEGIGTVIDMDFSSTSRIISSPALKSGGTIYCYGSNDMGQIEVPFRDLLFKSMKLHFFLVYELDAYQRNRAIDQLNAFLRSGQSQTRISHVLPLEEIVKAHQLVESGEADGNVVLTI